MRRILFTAILLLVFGEPTLAEDLYVCKTGDKRIVMNTPCKSNQITTSTAVVESPAVAAERERQGQITQERLKWLSDQNSKEHAREAKEEATRQEAIRQAQQKQYEAQQKQQEVARQQQLIQEVQQLRREQAAATAAAKDAAAAANNAAANRGPSSCYQKMNGAIYCY